MSAVPLQREDIRDNISDFPLRQRHGRHSRMRKHDPCCEVLLSRPWPVGDDREARDIGSRRTRCLMIDDVTGCAKARRKLMATLWGRAAGLRKGRTTYEDQTHRSADYGRTSSRSHAAVLLVPTRHALKSILQSPTRCGLSCTRRPHTSPEP